ncbi:hypothetical protein NPIL_591641 [Nephila pilipes]|uniref:Uncharacterized protein n=1 Tax=Nephila pilipes TaxID=299642 RepID=A0A8X6UMC7_NEPPI|nr:hypothetical protein NPIL_591641 [Nephila pilipes]
MSSEAVDIKKEDGGESGISISKDSSLVDNSSSSKDKLDISEHSVISLSSSDKKEVSFSNITTMVLPSLFSNLSANVLTSLQSYLSSAFPLTSLPNSVIATSCPVSCLQPRELFCLEVLQPSWTP